jgi:uncharacterized protein (TIGR03382 family)
MSKGVQAESGLPGATAPMAFMALLAAMGVAILFRRRN